MHRRGIVDVDVKTKAATALFSLLRSLPPKVRLCTECIAGTVYWSGPLLWLGCHDAAATETAIVLCEGERPDRFLPQRNRCP